MSTPVFDPANVLGCTEEEARSLLNGKRVTPGEGESVAGEHYAWRRHMREPNSYWVAVTQVAYLLHTPPTVVKRMLDEHRLRYVVHTSGVRLMRRHEIEELAAARVRPPRPPPHGGGVTSPSLPRAGGGLLSRRWRR